MIMLRPTNSGAQRLTTGPKAATVATDASSNRRKEIQDQLRKQEEQRKKNTEGSLRVLMERAQMTSSPTKLRVICGIIGVVISLVIITQGLNPLFAILPPLLCVAILPKKVARSKIKKLEKKFLAVFPDAIDVLVRGVKTGLPVNEGMRLVSREMPHPVGPEFMQITDETGVGVTLDDALERTYRRLPLPEVNFFKIVLTIQKQTGGNLSEALGNLSTTLRDRKKLKLKIVALSSEAKASAMIIGSLPFILACVLFAISPDYITTLFVSPTGQYVVGFGLFWMGVGIFVMKTMIDIDI